MHFADVLRLTLIHVGKIDKDVALGFFLIEQSQHFECSLTVEHVAVLGANDLFSFVVVQASKVLVVDVFDVHPLYLKIAFELKSVVLPPEREGFLMIA